MKYLINENNIINGILYQEDIDKILDEEIEFGFDKFINGKVVKEDKELVKQEREQQFKEYKKIHENDELRAKRECECFAIINRGAPWYANLKSIQIEELNSWYNDWLNVTETKTIPTKPSWIK